MRKQQLTVYLDPTTFSDFAAYASRRGHPKSLVAEAAIASFVSPDAAGRQETAIAKRLDRIVRVLERLERNDGIALETLALFIRSWLTANPATTDQGSASARAKGAERYDRFIEALGRRLAAGASLTQEIAEDRNSATNDRLYINDPNKV